MSKVLKPGLISESTSEQEKHEHPTPKGTHQIHLLWALPVLLLTLETLQQQQHFDMKVSFRV